MSLGQINTTLDHILFADDNAVEYKNKKDIVNNYNFMTTKQRRKLQNQLEIGTNFNRKWMSKNKRHNKNI